MSSSDLLPGKISDTNTGSKSDEIAIGPFPVLCPLFSDQVQLCCMICDGFSIKILGAVNYKINIRRIFRSIGRAIIVVETKS